MSAPAFAWALEQGRRLTLSVSERMLLIALADRANGDGYCFPGQDTLIGDTGLSERSIRDVALSLQRHELIRIEKLGRSLRYHIVRANGAGHGEAQHRQPLPVSATTPAAAAAIIPATTAGIEGGAAQQSSNTGNSAPAIPATIAAKPKTENQVSKEEPPPVVPPRAGGGSRGRPLPAGWMPTEKSIAFAIDLGLTAAEVLAEADAMRDWASHRGETGKDWDSRFNNWIRKEVKDRYLRGIRGRKTTLAEEWGLSSLLTPVFDDDEPPPRRLLS